jgi:hypothetical protein
VEPCQRREDWNEDDRLSAVNAWLSEVDEGTAQDAAIEKITCRLFFFLAFLISYSVLFSLVTFCSKNRKVKKNIYAQYKYCDSGTNRQI